MKQRIDSVTFRSLASSLVFTGGCVLGFAAPASDPPDPRPSLSAPTNIVTLDAAIRMALESNPELRASAARIDAAEGRARQARLWSNPDLELRAEDWPVDGGGGFSDSKQTLGVAQTIPFPGKKKLDGEIGASGVRLSEAECRLRQLELVRDVKTAFYEALAAERFVEVAGELATVAGSSANAARKRVAAGAAADQELLRAEIPLEQAMTELAGFERDRVAARQTLALLLGRPDLTEASLSGALAETASLALVDTGPEQWLVRHPAVAAMQTSHDLAEIAWRRARLEPYPDVTMDVAGGRIGGTGESIIQLGISVPLPVIDRSKGRAREAEAQVRVAEADRLAVEQRLLRAWGTAGKRFRTALEQATRYRERILPRADEALRLVQTGFEQGKFGFIDLLDTQRTAAEVRLAYQQQLLELNIARAEIEFLLGGDDGAASPAALHQPTPQTNSNDL